MKPGNTMRRLLSVYITVTMVLSGMFGLLLLNITTISAQTVELSHDAGALDFNVNNHATLPFCIKYNNVQQSDDAGGWLDDTYFFFDQSQYDHSGTGDIATGEYPTAQEDWEFDTTESDVPLSFLENGVIDRSFGSFTKVEDINGQANDIRLFQTAWSKQGEDWGIIQWTVQNLYDTNLTKVRFGLKFHACIDGDNADDKAYWNSTHKVYYIKDSGSATYFGFASADSGAPINMYWDGSINDLAWDGDIYSASVASPHVSGFFNDLGCIIGWTDDEVSNNGLNISADESITRPLIMAVGSSYADLLTKIENARQFYLPRTLIITEIADEGTPRVEIHTTANVTQDLTNIGLSVDGGISHWSGGFWDVNPIPGKGYSVWTLAGGDAFDGTEGDTIGLYNISSGLKCDEVAFGQEGVAPDPINNPTIGSISRVFMTDWIHSLQGMTFGAQNNEQNPINTAPEVVLNEVMFNPALPEYGFIELMYIGDSSVDLDGFAIVTDNIEYISGSHVLDPDDPYYLVFRNDAPWLFNNGNVSNSADNVYLYDNNGALLDMVGWNTPHQVNKTMTRVPDGFGSYQGFNNVTSEAAGWVFDQGATIPLVKVYPKFQFEYGDPSDEVWYNLTINNSMSTGALFDILNQSLPGWIVEIYSDYLGTKIGDSDGDGNPDIFINASSEVDISIKVTIPSSGIVGDYGDATITVMADFDPSISNYAILQTRFYPYLIPGKSIIPSQININGTGYGELATITLNVSGSGFGIETLMPQDVVFVIDRSSSMLPGDIDLAKQAMIEYVENMSNPDSGAVVYFDTDVVLMSSLTSNYNKLINDIESIPGPGDLTYMGEALLEALQELNANGDADHSHVIILLTDGGWNGNLSPETVAYWARENYTYIYTIGLGGGGETVLREIANITGAEYYYAETAEDLRGIYQIIATIIDKTAGRDLDITDSDPMIRDVLPPWIDYVPGSFSIEPDHIYVNESGYTILEWNVSRILIDEVWEVTFDVKSTMAGYLEA
ncbi:MAG: VWA domain-containing protein, partial [Thermoplasmata archaeon]